jgi:hypothetical protein
MIYKSHLPNILSLYTLRSTECDTLYDLLLSCA